MCGIAGLWHAGAADLEELAAIGVSMRDALTPRGPDDADLSVDARAGLVLGHRRLAILDLSPEGRQPMRSPSGRYEIVFNGEVYNHLALRRDLPGVAWRGSSDTETLLAAFDAWGVDGAVVRFVGMFALALWDREARALHLVRDRLGIKPLVWGRSTDGALLFGSELHALRAHPRFDTSVDPEALSAFFETSCVPAPRTIHRAARKLLPGTIATFSAPGAAPVERRFWDPRAVFLEGQASPLAGDDRSLLDAIEATLKDAVRLRLLADVPLGAFLSGGIDSSLVVALAQEVASAPLQTFSIGSTDAAYDESSFAEETARVLGTRHTAFRLGAAEALEVIPRLPTIFDEPFSDSSQIPTFLVCQLARRHVTVALSGDGGDEVFGGYNRYLWGPRVAELTRRVPASWRGSVADLLEAVPQARWDGLAATLSPPLPRTRLLGDKLHKAARGMRAEGIDGLHAALRRQWNPSPMATPTPSPSQPLPAAFDARTRLAVRDLLEYLPDDILTKVDRASMAVALEARVPLLDHRVVELAARLPERMKIRGGKGKWALRELLARRVPRRLFERPKTGFSVPIGAWLRGPLRGWAESLLERSALDGAGLDAGRVLARWHAHLDGRDEAGLALWDVLSYRAWQVGLTRGESAPRRGPEGGGAT